MPRGESQPNLADTMQEDHGQEGGAEDLVGKELLKEMESIEPVRAGDINREELAESKKRTIEATYSDLLAKNEDVNGAVTQLFEIYQEEGSQKDRALHAEAIMEGLKGMDLESEEENAKLKQLIDSLESMEVVEIYRVKVGLSTDEAVKRSQRELTEMMAKGGYGGVLEGMRDKVRNMDSGKKKKMLSMGVKLLGIGMVGFMAAGSLAGTAEGSEYGDQEDSSDGFGDLDAGMDMPETFINPDISLADKLADFQRYMEIGKEDEIGPYKLLWNMDADGNPQLVDATGSKHIVLNENNIGEYVTATDDTGTEVGEVEEVVEGTVKAGQEPIGVEVPVEAGEFEPAVPYESKWQPEDLKQIIEDQNLGAKDEGGYSAEQQSRLFGILEMNNVQLSVLHQAEQNPATDDQVQELIRGEMKEIEQESRRLFKDASNPDTVQNVKAHLEIPLETPGVPPTEVAVAQAKADLAAMDLSVKSGMDYQLVSESYNEGLDFAIKPIVIADLVNSYETVEGLDSALLDNGPFWKGNNGEHCSITRVKLETGEKAPKASVQIETQVQSDAKRILDGVENEDDFIVGPGELAVKKDAEGNNIVYIVTKIVTRPVEKEEVKP